MDQEDSATTRRVVLPLHRQHNNLEQGHVPATRLRKGQQQQQQQQVPCEINNLDNDNDDDKRRRTRLSPRKLFRVAGDYDLRHLNCKSIRQLWRKQTVIDVLEWMRQYPKRALAVMAVIAVILRPSLTWKWYTTNFGRHYLQGGSIGKRWLEDGSMREALRQKLQREQAQLEALGIGQEEYYHRPDLNDRPFRVLNLRFDTAYRTLLVQREQRAMTLAKLEQNSLQQQRGAVVASTAIPDVMFVPQTIGWVPPRPKTLTHLQRITFDDQERQQAILDACPTLDGAYQSAKFNDKIHIWSLCMIYYYGGYFLGDRIQSPGSNIDGIIDGLNKGRSVLGTVSFSDERIHVLVATPRHPIVGCIIHSIAETRHESFENLSKVLLLGHDHGATASLRCSLEESQGVDFCATMQFTDSKTPSSKKGMAILSVMQQESATAIDLGNVQSTNVTIAKRVFDDPKRQKRTIESQLWERGIQPSWACMRCLMMPMYGKMSKCTRFCNPAYTDFMCNPADEDVVIHPVPVTIARTNRPELAQIPRIVHQTWFEDINLDRYPQLARLQNSWKQSGWEYRLYTDDSARRYILDNFPPIFAEAFDALKPGAFRADFFRYLVLMKEGGVYSDVDVLLETNLDNLIRPGLSFFVPRDVVAEYADEAYCLWNGLIGAVPGHPIIIRAVERLVNHIIERADIHDMERAICRNDPDTDLWKIHTQPLLILTGPCALGISMNEALGRPSLTGIEIGGTSLEIPNESSVQDAGDALVLILDKYDLGGMRFSDPDRNVIVASTNFEGLEKSARHIVHPSEAEKKRQEERKTEVHIHYSKATKGSFVWGSDGIYRDKLVSKFRINFLVNYI